MRDTTDGNVESADAIERIRLNDGSGIIMEMIENKEDPREDKRRMNTIASNGFYTYFYVYLSFVFVYLNGIPCGELLINYSQSQHSCNERDGSSLGILIQ
ncbi:unnamed protein product [Albugo candida]|uniref:Uncharacterized protein n=1 Tax=Albugo candida TaxID=65357 RepID=A0A024FVW7_9STRA|nr:unnamed protein product [Albugo candida]|eukprot:CCI11275.1 unnamed protein product [Albugo candida]